MELKLTRRRIYELTEDGRFLGELKYKNGLSYKAKIRLTNTDLYEIKPKGFWGTTIGITKNGIEIGEMTMTWKGDVRVTNQDGREFVLDSKGFINPHYTFKSKSGGILIRYFSKFNWRKFRNFYTVEFDRPTPEPFLVLLGMYATRYYITMVTAATS